MIATREGNTLTWTVRAFHPDGTDKNLGSFPTHQAAMNKKVEMMHRTQEEDIEYYVIRFYKP